MEENKLVELIKVIEAQLGEGVKCALVVWEDGKDTTCVSNEKDVVRIKDVLERYIYAIEGYSSVDDMEMM